MKTFLKTTTALLGLMAVTAVCAYGGAGDNIAEGVSPGTDPNLCPDEFSADYNGDLSASPRLSFAAGVFSRAAQAEPFGLERHPTGGVKSTRGPESIPWRGGGIDYGMPTDGPGSLGRSGSLPGTGVSVVPRPGVQLTHNYKKPSPTHFSPTFDRVQLRTSANKGLTGSLKPSFSGGMFTAKLPNQAGNFKIEAGATRTLPGANYGRQGSFEDQYGNALTVAQVGSAPAGKYFVLTERDGTRARYDAGTGKAVDYRTAQGKRVSVQTGGNAGADIVESGGELRQIKTPSGLTNIRLLPGKNQGYVTEYYDKSQVADKNADGLYAFTGAPRRSMTIENPNWQSGDIDTMKITGTEGDRTSTNTYTYNESNKEWTNVRGDGSRVTERETEPVEQPINIGTRFDVMNGKLTPPDGTPAGSARIKEKTKELYDASNNLVSRTKTIYWMPDDGSEQKLALIKDAGGLNETTTWTYYTNPEDRARYGKIKSVHYSSGDWETYTYDDEGRVQTATEPYLDTPYTENPAPVGTRQTRFDYTPVIAGDTLRENDLRPRTVTQFTAGIETSRRYYAYPKNNDTGEAQEIVEHAAAQGAACGAAGNQRVTTTYYAETAAEASAGKVKSVSTSAGLLTTITYQLAGENLITTKTEGTTASPAGVSGKTLRRIITQNGEGLILSEETQIYTGGSYVRLNLFESRYDVSGKLIQSLKDGRVTYDAVWHDDLLTSETDETGIRTDYTYDAMKELKTATKRGTGDQPDIITTYNRTAGGLDCGCTGSMEIIASAGGLTQRSDARKDKLGRTTEETTTTELTTTHAYSNGGRTVTTLFPNTATKITESYPDGTVKSITGTGVVPEYYTGGINADGTRWLKTTLVSPDGPRWSKVTTDFLGRVMRTEKPGFAGAIITETFAYNNAGRVASSKQTVTGGNAPTSTGSADLQTTTYAYDGLGTLIKTEITRGDITNTTETDTSYVVAGGSVWLESFQKQDGIVTARSRTRVGASLATPAIASESWSMSLPQSNAPTPVWDETTATRQLVTLDRTTATQVAVTKLPTSIQPAITTTVAGLTVSTVSPTHGGTDLFRHDALGRLTGQKQARHTLYSKIEYNAKNQITSAADAAGNATTYLYYANGTLGAGQLRMTTDALGGQSFYQYDERGQKIYTWGDSVYPVAQGYDTYGQLILLRTFRTAGNTPTKPTVASDNTVWTYDEATGALLQKTYAAGKGPTYDYYADGQLRTRLWARLNPATGERLATNYTYNARGQRVGIDYSDDTPDVTFAYNTRGQVIQVTDGTGARTYDYASENLALTTETFTGLVSGTLHRAHDAYNRQTGYALVTSQPIANSPSPIASVATAATYSCDSFGRLNQVTGDAIPAGLNLNAANNTLNAATFRYERVTNSDLIAGITDDALTVTNTYEPNRNALTKQINASNVTGVLSRYEYTYDALSRRKNQKQTGSAFEHASTENFLYNTRSEVTGSETTNTDTGTAETDLARAYEYDSIGNRINATDNTGTTHYETNALNQYLSVKTPAATAAPTYDADGNLILDGDGMTLTWDGENRLIKTQKDGTTVTYKYDTNARRIEKTVITGGKTETTKFIYNRWLLIREEKTTATGGTTEIESNTYTWGLDLSNTLQKAGGIGGLLSCDNYKTGTRTHYVMLYDGRGNITGRLTTADNTLATQSYDAFGRITKTTGDIGSFGFSTKYADKETGLIYYGYRYYSSYIGKWINRDPLQEMGGINLYGFLYNSVLNGIDPLGESFWGTVWGTVGGTVGNVAISTLSGAASGAVTGGVVTAITGPGFLAGTGAGAIIGGVGGFVSGVMTSINSKGDFAPGTAAISGGLSGVVAAGTAGTGSAMAVAVEAEAISITTATAATAATGATLSGTSAYLQTGDIKAAAAAAALGGLSGGVGGAAAAGANAGPLVAPTAGAAASIWENNFVNWSDKKKKEPCDESKN